jgi:hypothetical protein
MTKLKKILIISTTVFLIIIVYFGFLSKKQVQINTGKIAKEIFVDDISPTTRKTLESLVRHDGQLVLIDFNKEKNIFVILYIKNIKDAWTNYVAIAIGQEVEENFHLVYNEEVPVSMYGKFSYTNNVHFIDFNNDGLEDIYIGTFLDNKSIENDGFVLLQKKSGGFVLAKKESGDLFRYTSMGGGLEFIDVDNDGKPEILITERVDMNPDYQSYKKKVIFLKLEDDRFFFWKTETKLIKVN